MSVSVPFSRSKAIHSKFRWIHLRPTRDTNYYLRPTLNIPLYETHCLSKKIRRTRKIPGDSRVAALGVYFTPRLDGEVRLPLRRLDVAQGRQKDHYAYR